MKYEKTIAFTLIFAISLTILILGKNLIIPFILALLVWFLIVEFRNILTKIPFLGNKLKEWIWTLIASLMLFGFMGFVVNLLFENIKDLGNNLQTYEANLLTFNESLKNHYQLDILDSVTNFIGDFDFTTILKQLFASLTDLFGNAFLIILYVLFILLEESTFGLKIKALFTDPKKHKETEVTLEKINKSISNYITLKTIISIITGVFSYIALYFIGVDTPIFWAFLIFLFNYIPTIGSLIGTLFPAFIALMQFGDITHPLLVITIVGVIQLIVGNFLEPKIMGNSLNLSPLIVIISLSVWGSIWGIVGMVLSVPITVIMIILFAQFKSTKPIAILLSEKGIV